MFLLLFLFNSFCLDLKESNVSLKLTIVETVGYGDQINKEDRYELSINNYIHAYFYHEINHSSFFSVCSNSN